MFDHLLDDRTKLLSIFRKLLLGVLDDVIGQVEEGELPMRSRVLAQGTKPYPYYRLKKRERELK